MNTLFSNLQSAMQNKHVSVPALLMVGCVLGEIWFPHYASQFKATSKLFEGYGLIAAANCAPAK